MANELVGVVVKTFPIETGQSKTGKDWSKAQVLIETQGQFPRQVLFEDMTGKSGIDQYKEGEMIKVMFELESREFNNRYYTSARAWRSERYSDTPQPAPQQPRQQTAQRPGTQAVPQQFQNSSDDDTSDLPF